MACFVNHQQVQEAVLHAGDEVQIGQSLFVYVAVSAGPRRTDLANRISMISRTGQEAPSAIVKTVSGGEAGRLLAQPDQAGNPWLRNALALAA